MISGVSLEGVLAAGDPNNGSPSLTASVTAKHTFIRFFVDESESPTHELNIASMSSGSTSIWLSWPTRHRVSSCCKILYCTRRTSTVLGSESGDASLSARLLNGIKGANSESRRDAALLSKATGFKDSGFQKILQTHTLPFSPKQSMGLFRYIVCFLILHFRSASHYRC